MIHTRAEQKSALSLFASHHPSAELAFRLIGWVEMAARREIQSGVTESVADMLAGFVLAHETQILACKLAQPNMPK